MKRSTQCKRCGVWIPYGHMREHREGLNGYGPCDLKAAEATRSTMRTALGGVTRTVLGKRTGGH